MRSRYSVTRRGNVHDNVERRTVFATHGMGSIKERLVIAQTWIAQQPETREDVKQSSRSVVFSEESRRAFWLSDLTDSD